MGKSRVEVYLSQQEIQTLRERAVKEGKSISVYCAGILRRSVLEDLYKEVDSKIHFEERIRALFSLGAEELKKPLRAAEDLMAKAGVYACANFELLKQQPGITDFMRKEALRTAARRVREPLEQALGAEPEVKKPKIEFGKK